MTRIDVVVGGQYGSEAKGATVAKLVAGDRASSRDAVIRVAGPNAGHTAYDSEGREWKLRAVPVAAVVNSRCQLRIAAGSEVDLGVLLDEITQLEAAGHSVTDRLRIHPAATILQAKHIAQEQAGGIVGRIGSTGKGIGAARADRVMRRAVTFGEFVTGSSMVDQGGWLWSDLVDPSDGPLDPNAFRYVVIEGTQGYGLGLHTRQYPQVTSSNCRAIDFLAMAGISPWDDAIDMLRVIVVARAFPIRVAGNSGPLKGETTWEALGLPQERTTVTNKVRRVGEWDEDLLQEAVWANGGGGFNPKVVLAITMLDQKFPQTKGATTLEHIDGAPKAWIDEIEERMGADVKFIGTSPTTMIEVGQ